MRIDIRAINIPLAPETRAAIEQRTRMALGRVASRVADVRLVLEDLNGPRKGIDRMCTVAVRLSGSGEIHAQAAEAVIRNAVDAALDRASRATLRLLARQREFRRETLRVLSSEAVSRP